MHPVTGLHLLGGDKHCRCKARLAKSEPHEVSPSEDLQLALIDPPVHVHFTRALSLFSAANSTSATFRAPPHPSNFHQEHCEGALRCFRIS